MAFDPSPIQAFFAQPLNVVLAQLLINFGWIPIAFTILWGAKELWLYYRSGIWGDTQESIFLAIDIPRSNEQSPKAVENMFVYFAGAHSSFNLIEKYWIGMYQLSFSFEIVSIDGYTQFLIRSPKKFRNLVESAVYSQYPDAEITEINDYTEGMPAVFPDEEWDIWGAEFILAKKAAYPIKTYPTFMDNFGRPESTFKDPMASLMDLCSSLNKGEQLWYQIIVYPIGFDWTEEMEKEVKKILKEKSASSAGSGFFSAVFNEIWGLIGEALRQLTGGGLGMLASAEAQEDALKMLSLKPKEKKQVEAIQHKTSQVGFEAKHRFIYIAKKEVINKPKVVNGFVGYMKQFADLDLNNLKPDMAMTATSGEYFFVNYTVNDKKRKIMSAYKRRSGTLGRKRFIMTVDELATLWHFPVEEVVKAPLVQKAPGRKAEPPISLPVGDDLPAVSNFEEVLALNPDMAVEMPLAAAAKKKAPPPSALPKAAAAALPWGNEDLAPPEAKPAKKEAKASNSAKDKSQAPDNLPFA